MRSKRNNVMRSKRRYMRKRTNRRRTNRRRTNRRRTNRRRTNRRRTRRMKGKMEAAMDTTDDMDVDEAASELFVFWNDVLDQQVMIENAEELLEMSKKMKAEARKAEKAARKAEEKAAEAEEIKSKLQIGQRIKFLFGKKFYKGTITGLNKHKKGKKWEGNWMTITFDDGEVHVYELSPETKGKFWDFI